MDKDKEKKSEKSEVAKREEETLKFWQDNKIFEKSLEKPSPKGEFVFYEGPPTANGKPGIHHLEARAFKDIIPRYKTMRGFHVRRKAGWDTHGLPVELQVEKELGLKSKKDIEKYGIEAFNKKCKESVWQYLDIWQKFTDRIGFWLDQENPYVTYESNYIESVWNILKTVDDKKLLYKDYKVLPWCPRCGTALSSHELAQGYQDDKDLAVTVKFKIKGVDNGYFLAWTTTPWTLPGNVALAVGNDITYVEAKVGNEVLVLAKERLSIINESYEIIAEHKGSECVGMEYEPSYPFMLQKFGQVDKQQNTEAFTKAYKIYSADFVNTTEGTGIVHTAVMYGQDDFTLGSKIGLPKYHLVNEDGRFMEGMDFLSNRFVKDEDVAVDIIKNLAHRGLLFKKEKYEHSYPHCWRCKTPLIYYARDSWYIKMSSLRDELIKENESINWEPSYIREGRFGEWLREVKDWAISRERYWGTPLPIWSDKNGNYQVIGSIDDLKKRIKSRNNHFIIVRHGKAENNEKNIVSSKVDDGIILTEEGKTQIEVLGRALASKKISAIYVSPLSRTKQSADIIAEKISYLKEKIIIDDRLAEFDFGDLNGTSFDKFLAYKEKKMKAYDVSLPNGESYLDAKKRFGAFIYEINSQHKGETIVVVTHGIGSEVLEAVIKGANNIESKSLVDASNYMPGSTLEFDFIPLPHNENYELDLHRPFIDQIELVNENNEKLTRVKEVMDVWFDSGSMPFAQDHYPFDFAQGKPFEGKDLAYPADFISEAIDQTRGWFYTLHAIGVLMSKGKAYKNVICLGHILDVDGKKMSKSLGNIVDPWTMMDKYGADALRLWMYSVNQSGDSKNFDEKTVDEIIKKVFNPTINILAFYELYKDESVKSHNKSKHILDKWIIYKLNELIKEGTESLDKYQVFEAARFIRDFVGDFSTWYIRRSRERFKSDNVQEKNDALATTGFVLTELAKYMAPFVPFIAEEIYQKVKLRRLNTDSVSGSRPDASASEESVHLCDWPKAEKIDKDLLNDMEKVRKTVTEVLEARSKAGIKVRQPLASLVVKEDFSFELRNILAEEVNVKELIIDEKLETPFELDITITPELKNEGNIRDFIRAVQEVRKMAGLKPSQTITLSVETNDEGKKFIESNISVIKKPTNVGEIVFENNSGEELEIENRKYKIEIK